MYYSNGNYEAFARPRKPQGVDQKSAHLIGGGVASLAAAAFLIRDGQMDGSRITVYEASSITGGCLDGIKDREEGYLFRGEREMEDHYECMWDLYRSIPSLDVEDASVLEDFYRINKDRPTYNTRRTTQNRGQPVETEGKMLLSRRAQREIMKLFFTRREDLYDKRFDEVVGEDFFRSNFWVYWQSMFAIAPWHGALEMKLYANRFVHHFHGFSDLSTIKWTRYNQFDSLIRPLLVWLEKHGVTIQYDTRVTNVVFDITPERKVARRIEWLRDEQRGGVDVTENDLVLTTIGSPVEATTWGDHHTPPVWNQEIGEGSIWALWRNIAAQDPGFGRPDKFCTDTEKSSYVSACIVTLDEKIPRYIQQICGRDPFAFDGNVVTGGMVTVRDSNWFLSWNVEREPHFPDQPHDQLMAHAYGAYSLDRPGNYVKKAMRECNGEEIAQEWLYHMGVPDDEIEDLAARSVVCHPCMMPYVTAFFLPRRAGDRPDVVPEHAVNFGFLGQFAESSPRDVIFTVEYSIRTAMEAVYTLLDIERGVPEPWGSQYDVRALLNSMAVLGDGEKLPLPAPLVSLLERTDIGELLRQYGLIGQLDDPDLITVAMRKDPPRGMTVL
ncbi:oleate hydratase [Streptomyces sp. MOE7]|uniref:oleate hydratase n=1 Tax=Streptomyces sp. MOE7 TaxID=1961713 RepID=UPI000A048726|nr:oleate hydratase [Streptomyces sp. MOE7]ARH89160.1 oleate hydratase [Streptomyces sp. MOE7]